MVWDAESGSVLRELAAHSKEIDDVVISPDGRLAATASFDGTALVWRLP